jgi:5-methylcytosine-specific restriction endonuclease McrA
MLDGRALVLNRSWVPVSTTSVRRAVLLMARGVAGAVHPETYEVASWDTWVERGPMAAARLRGVAFDLPVPEVIVLTHYNGFPDFPVAFTRRNVYRRDGHRCMYCGERPRPDHLTIDHVVPRSRGGPTSWDNCVTACIRCNAKKANRSAREAGLTLLQSPATPRWPGGLDPEAVSQRPIWKRFLSHKVSSQKSDSRHDSHRDSHRADTLTLGTE